MPTQDNSPTRGYIRWYDTRLIFQGSIYKIKDGYSNNRYIYWHLSDPNMFKSSDVIPIGSEIIFLNNAGIATTYPYDGGISLENINSTNASNKLLYDHIGNNQIHFSGMDKELLYLLSSKVDDLIERIQILEDKINKEGTL